MLNSNVLEIYEYANLYLSMQTKCYLRGQHNYIQEIMAQAYSDEGSRDNDNNNTNKILL